MINQQRSIVLFGLMLLAIFTMGSSPLSIVREEVKIPMRDGIHLGATMYRPEAEGKYPAIVFRTPYSKDDYDASAEFPRRAALHGYVVFLVDVRGRYTSEGEFTAYANEKKDGYDTIEWVGHSPYCNGSVGTYGQSYPGYVQWLALSEAPPSLKAASPQKTPISSHHFFYVGGAFSYPWFDWFMPYILPNKRARAEDKSGTWDEATAETEWNNAKQKGYEYRPLLENPILQKYAPEYYEWLKHPDDSPWWDFADATKSISRIQAPVFLESGWYDSAYGPIGATEGFNRMRKEAGSPEARANTRLVFGPYNHTVPTIGKTSFGDVNFGPTSGFDYNTELLRWFDRTLKHESAVTLPPVSIFVMGENRWRSENEWPPARAVQTSYYIHSNGQAVSSKTAGSLTKDTPAGEPVDSYVFDPNDPVVDAHYDVSVPYDQRPIENRRDVLVYTSEVLQEDVEVTGEVIADLFVSSSAKDTDFTITLCDVYPDGKSINLSGLDSGYLRMRYRNGFEKQELIIPGKTYRIRIGGLYTSNLFRKGHRIRLDITSSKSPLYDPNPNTGAEIATEKNLIPATQRIYHDKANASRLILPVIPR